MCFGVVVANPASSTYLHRVTRGAMPAKEIWPDFKELPQRTGPAKHQHSGVAETAKFRRWQCPNCTEVIEAQVTGSEDRKAKTCARHYWGSEKPCPNRPGDDLRGQPKPKAVAPAPATEATAAVELRQMLEQQFAESQAAAERRHVEREAASERRHAEMLAEMTAKKDRYKRSSKAYHEGTGVSSPSSSDSDGGRAAKCARATEHHEAKGVVEGRRVAYTVLGESLGCEAPDEPESVDDVVARVEKRSTDLRKEEQLCKRARLHFDRLARELGLPPKSLPAEQLDAVRQLEKDKKSLKRDLSAAQGAVAGIEREDTESRTLNACFKEFPNHPVEARKLLRAVSLPAHPDKHPGEVEKKLAEGLQQALNVVKSRVGP